METEARQVNWVVPILIVTFTALTLIALLSWVQVVFGGFVPGTAPFGGAGGMMGAGGIMTNTANAGPAGVSPDMSAHMKAMMGSGDMPKTCATMQSDPKLKAVHNGCAKIMGSNGDNIQQQTNNTGTDKTL